MFGGEVESLTTAGVEGIGVRVIADHRQGYAWAGSLDAERRRRDAARRARQRGVRRARRVVRARGAGRRQRCRARPTLDLWRDELAAVPTDEKVRIALELERATKAADPRIRNVESASYGDSLDRGRARQLARRRGAHAPHDVLARRRSRSPTTAPARRPGYGFVAGRSLADLDLESIPRDAVDARVPPARRASRSPGRRIPVILDPLVTRSVLGVLSSAFNGESMLKGRSLFAGRAGELIGAPHRAAARRSDRPARARRGATYDSEGVPTRRNDADRRRRAAGVPAERVHRPPFGRGHDRQRGARLHVDTGRRRARAAPRARRRSRPSEIMASVREALYVQSVSGLHSGTNPISGDFSVGADGLMVRDGEFAEPVREVTIASTLQRMLLDIADIGTDLTFLPGAVAGMTVLVGEMTLSGA